MLDHIAPAIVVDATLYTLLLFSVITWTLIFFKSWQYARNHYDNNQYQSVFWNASDLESAQQLPPARGSKARLAAAGFNWLTAIGQNQPVNLKFRGDPKELLQLQLYEQAQHEQRKIENGLTILASIGSTAPFVGLLGTVLGIMHALHDISQSGSASLDVVAGPIGDALIATAVGIGVAVPAVLAYNFFVRRARLHRIALEHFVDNFLHIATADDYTKG